MITLKTSQILVKNSYSNVYIVDPPESLTNYILISNSGGFGVGTADAGFARPTIQIMVAHVNKANLNSNIHAIRELLYEITADEIDTDLGSTQDIKGYDISSDIIDLGRDEQRRYIASINFIVYENI